MEFCRPKLLHGILGILVTVCFLPRIATAQLDVAIVKIGPPSVVAGGVLPYTLTVTNNGPGNAAAVTVTDLLPWGQN